MRAYFVPDIPGDRIHGIGVQGLCSRALLKGKRDYTSCPLGQGSGWGLGQNDAVPPSHSHTQAGSLSPVSLGVRGRISPHLVPWGLMFVQQGPPGRGPLWASPALSVLLLEPHACDPNSLSYSNLWPEFLSLRPSRWRARASNHRSVTQAQC